MYKPVVVADICCFIEMHSRYIWYLFPDFFLQKLISSRKVISLHQKSIFIPIDRYRGVCFIPKSVLFIFNTIATHSSSRCTANKVFLHRKNNQRGFFQMLGYPIVIQVKLDPLLLCANTQKGEGASSLLSFHRVCVFFFIHAEQRKIKTVTIILQASDIDNMKQFQNRVINHGCLFLLTLLRKAWTSTFLPVVTLHDTAALIVIECWCQK